MHCDRNTFRVALDIGHDKLRSGATSARGVTEFTYNLALGKRIRTALQAAGFPGTFLINEAGAPLPLLRRPALAREQDGAIFISIHHDSVQPEYLSQWPIDGQLRPYSDRFRGYAIFISGSSTWSKESLVLAEDLGHSLKAQGLTPSLYHAETIPHENRPLLNSALGIHRFDELAVLRGATMPAVLLEAGVILNRDEERAIQDGPHHAKVAAAMVAAISRYCKP